MKSHRHNGWPRLARGLVILTAALWPSSAHAGDLLVPGTPELDRPTLMALGVKLPISGDDNHNAFVSVRDIITHASDLIRFERLPFELNEEILDRAFESCFLEATEIDE